MMHLQNIIPMPKTIIQQKGIFNRGKKLWFLFQDEQPNDVILDKLHKIFPDSYSNECSDLLFLIDKNLTNQEEYHIDITPTNIVVRSYNPKGWYYALQTIEQLIDGLNIPCVKISDYPDLEVRGVMVDISRGKVPKVETLKEMIDLFAKLKYNHLELYVEGFSYEYESFKALNVPPNYLTKEEYLEIAKYTKDHFIDFVPNQNGLGHMSDWLKLNEFHHLAECPEGFTIWGSKRAPSTLNPLDEGSIKLVKQMYADMLPYVDSACFNMNFDEPYELGHGKSKKAAEKTSIEDVYLDYLKVLAEDVRKYHKQPLIWGDVIIKHPEAVKKMDDDIILVDWGYGKNYPFDEHAKMLQSLNRPYLLAGGTNTWATIVGRYDDMFGSITHACLSAKKHGGMGAMVTDWGDMGHLQYLPASYSGFILGGISMWGNVDEELMKRALINLIGNESATAYLQLSHFPYLEGEYREYGSRLFASIMWAEHAQKYDNKLEFFDERMKSNYISLENEKMLKYLFTSSYELMKKAPKNLVNEEIFNSIFLLQILLCINVKLAGDCTDYHEELAWLEQYKENHTKLWKARNKEIGLINSISRIDWLIQILVQKQTKGDKNE